MQKSRIEWTDYSVNPIKGLCPVACSYCYARKMYKRFHWDENIRFEPEQAFVDAFNAPAGSKIFVGSTMELFGDWVKPNWLEQITGWPKVMPNKTFIFLTKQPQNLPKVFPDNCWVGVSATNEFDFMRHFNALESVKAKVKFWSFEPLLNWNGSPQGFSELLKQSCQWVIIGQQTPQNKKTMPKLEWVEEIAGAADKAKIPVFLKDNLIPMIDELPDNCFTKTLSGDMNLRQEMPKVK